MNVLTYAFLRRSARRLLQQVQLSHAVRPGRTSFPIAFGSTDVFQIMRNQREARETAEAEISHLSTAEREVSRMESGWPARPAEISHLSTAERDVSRMESGWPARPVCLIWAFLYGEHARPPTVSMTTRQEQMPENADWQTVDHFLLGCLHPESDVSSTPGRTGAAGSTSLSLIHYEGESGT